MTGDPGAAAISEGDDTEGIFVSEVFNGVVGATNTGLSGRFPDDEEVGVLCSLRDDTGRGTKTSFVPGVNVSILPDDPAVSCWHEAPCNSGNFSTTLS